MTRQDYERRFRTYPDVVTLPEFCAMLRIGDNYARRLLRKNLVAHFVIRHTYYISKENVIDFVLSPNYLTVLNRFRRDKQITTTPQAAQNPRCLRDYDFDTACVLHSKKLAYSITMKTEYEPKKAFINS